MYIHTLTPCTHLYVVFGLCVESATAFARDLQNACATEIVHIYYMTDITYMYILCVYIYMIFKWIQIRYDTCDFENPWATEIRYLWIMIDSIYMCVICTYVIYMLYIHQSAATLQSATCPRNRYNIHMKIYTHICVCIYTYICIYVYLYIYTSITIFRF